MKENKEITGLKIKSQVYKYRAFANNVMFIIENPTETMPRLLEEIKGFGELASFYIKKFKAKILCKDMTKKRQEELNKISGCEISTKVKYLGIYLAIKNLDLYKNNCERLGEQIQKDLNKWNSLKLSLLGQIATIKLNISPRRMFLFQTLPII